METGSLASLLLVLFTVGGTRGALGEPSCAADVAPVRFRAIDPACQFPDNATGTDTKWQLTSDKLACALLCAQRDTCKFFNFSSSRCALSGRPQGMTHRKLDARFSRCREVCANLRRFCVVQERLADTVNFSRNWQDYETGFGDVGAFWIGLRLLSLITAQSSSLTFRAEMQDWSNRTYVAEYAGFVVQNASANYAMNYTAFLAALSNVTGDSLGHSKGNQFSTLDSDNDGLAGGSCSTYYHSGAGWWFRDCAYANPNGLMTAAEVPNYSQAIHWWHVHDNRNSLKSIRLLLQLSD